MPSSVDNLVDVISYLGIFALFFFFLGKLLQYASRALDKENKVLKLDDFFKQYGYSYDYVLVFKVYDEKFDAFSDYQRRFTMGNIIDRLTEAGLETKCFYSCQRDEVYVKIRVTPERLRTEAARIGYRLLMNQDRLKAKLNLGKKRNGEWIWKPINIVDPYHISSIHPYQFIYAPYDHVAFHEDLYTEYPAYHHHKHIFRGVDR